jgi:uridine kinase
MAIKNLITNRFFVIGLILRLIMMALILPYAQNTWFVPFVRHFLDNPGFDPWTSFSVINSYGFPYGPVMFAGLLPFLTLGKIVETVFAVNTAAWVVKAAICSADFVLFFILLRMFPKNEKGVIFWYWLSPIVFAANYWAGQLDIIPMSILSLSLYYLQQNRFRKAGAALACAISAKFSMGIVVPFFLVYIIKNKRLAAYRMPFFASFLAGLSLLCAVPLFLSKGYFIMALGTRELDRLFELNLRLGVVPVFLTPILYGILLYVAWRMARMTFNLFFSLAGCSMLLLILTTVTPPGWYLWIIPFLVYHSFNAPSSQRWLGVYFVLASLGSQIMVSPVPQLVTPVSADAVGVLQNDFLGRFMPFWYSGCILLGTLLIIGMLREGILRNDLFKIGMRPVSIAIAGDSGSGKDTCARYIVGLLGEFSTVQVSGDNYHRWDRHWLMWKSLTHLSPQANELRRFNADVVSVLNRNPILCRIYDHSIGRFSAPVYHRASDFVLVTGLHALYMDNLNRLYDLRIFLDMREDLRVFFKCRRDVLERKHSREDVVESINKRKHDAGLYIAPQKENAHIIFTLEPEAGCALDDLSVFPRLRLRVILRGALYCENLMRNLTMSTFFVVDTFQGGNFEHILISGDCPAYVIENIALCMAPELRDIISLTPEWRSGVPGLMQLITVIHLMQNCRSRR